MVYRLFHLGKLGVESLTHVAFSLHISSAGLLKLLLFLSVYLTKNMGLVPLVAIASLVRYMFFSLFMFTESSALHSAFFGLFVGFFLFETAIPLVFLTALNLDFTEVGSYVWLYVAVYAAETILGSTQVAVCSLLLRRKAALKERYPSTLVLKHPFPSLKPLLGIALALYISLICALISCQIANSLTDISAFEFNPLILLAFPYFAVSVIPFFFLIGEKTTNALALMFGSLAFCLIVSVNIVSQDNFMLHYFDHTWRIVFIVSSILFGVLLMIFAVLLGFLAPYTYGERMFMILSTLNSQKSKIVDKLK